MKDVGHYLTTCIPDSPFTFVQIAETMIASDTPLQSMDDIGPPIFQTQNKGSLGLPSFTLIIMVGVFSLPAIALPLCTFPHIWEHPWLILLNFVGLFPLSVLYVLRRLMTRYGLRVYRDGSAEIIFPFNTVRIRQNELARVVLQTVYVASVGGNRTWIRFVGPDHRVMASLSPMAFSTLELQDFFEALKLANPSLSIQSI